MILKRASVSEDLPAPVRPTTPIFSIAHRINTIVDSDRIVVLDKGTVAEFGSPAALVKQKGLFYELVKEAGLLGSIEAAVES